VKPVKKKEETLAIPYWYNIPQTGSKSKEKRSLNNQLRTNDPLDVREIQEKKDSRDRCKKAIAQHRGF